MGFKANKKNLRVSRPKKTGVSRFVPIVVNPTKAQLDKYNIQYNKEKDLSYERESSPRATLKNGKWTMSDNAWPRFAAEYNEREGKEPNPAEYTLVDKLPKERVQVACVILYDMLEKEYVKKYFQWYSSPEVKRGPLVEAYITENNFVIHKIFNGKKKNGEKFETEGRGLRPYPVETGNGAYAGATGTFDEFINLLYSHFLTGGAQDETTGKAVGDKGFPLLTMFDFNNTVKGNFTKINKLLAGYNKNTDQAELGAAGLYVLQVGRDGRTRQKVANIFRYLQLNKATGERDLPFSLFNTPEILSAKFNETFARNLAVLEPVGPVQILTEEEVIALTNSPKLAVKPEKQNKKDDTKKEDNPLDGITPNVDDTDIDAPAFGAF